MWRCMKCGEEGEDNFDACWKCCVPREPLVAPAGLESTESEPVEPGDSSPDGERTKALTPPKCPSCSSERLRQGFIPGTGSLFEPCRIRFQPEENWFRSYLLQAWACLDCGHVSLFLSGEDVAALNG